MNDSPQKQTDPDIPDFAQLAADPEIAALLDFEPVPRKVKRPDGWTPELQREFIRLLAELGTPQRAAQAMGKKVSGIEGVYRDDEVGEFSAAWDKAAELAADRDLKQMSAVTFRRRIASPIAPNPSSIIAQVAGSGTSLTVDWPENWRGVTSTKMSKKELIPPLVSILKRKSSFVGSSTSTPLTLPPIAR